MEKNEHQQAMFQLLVVSFKAFHAAPVLLRSFSALSPSPWNNTSCIIIALGAATRMCAALQMHLVLSRKLAERLPASGPGKCSEKALPWFKQKSTPEALLTQTHPKTKLYNLALYVG